MQVCYTHANVLAYVALMLVQMHAQTKDLRPTPALASPARMKKHAGGNARTHVTRSHEETRRRKCTHVADKHVEMPTHTRRPNGSLDIPC